MNTAVDNGQIEGGIVQGLGWMTMEEVLYDADGSFAQMRYRHTKFLTSIPCRKRSLYYRSKQAVKT